MSVVSPFNLVGWALVATVFGWIVWRALKGSCSIEIDDDGIRTKGLFSWSEQERFLFSDIRRFEYRYVVRPLIQQRYGSWHLYAITVDGDKEIKHELPDDGKETFLRLKAALADWQIAHGCLQPPPLADLSDTVRY